MNLTDDVRPDVRKPPARTRAGRAGLALRKAPHAVVGAEKQRSSGDARGGGPRAAASRGQRESAALDARETGQHAPLPSRGRDDAGAAVEENRPQRHACVNRQGGPQGAKGEGEGEGEGRPRGGR